MTKPIVIEVKDTDEVFEMLFALLGMDDPSKPDVHTHRCPKKGCRHVWTHDRAQIPEKEGAYEVAHTCQKCLSGQCFLKFKDEADALKRG